MSLISLFVVVLVVCLILWLINTYLPLDRNIRVILTVAVVIILLLWLLQATGLLGGANLRLS